MISTGLVIDHFSRPEMQKTSTSRGGHSAIVKIRLLVNGDSIAVAQMGSDCLFIDAPLDDPPGDATIVMWVDDSERRWKVRLPDGISAGSERISIAALS
jgi:hypothetical protein